MGRVIEAAYAWGYLCFTLKRCFVWRVYVAHLPWQMRRCNRTPLKIRLFDQEREQVA